MGQIKDMMIDFCELTVQSSRSLTWQPVDFDTVMNRLIEGHVETTADFWEFVRVSMIIWKISRQSGRRQLRWATKLWNAIDCLSAPEVPWLLMARELPNVFHDTTNGGSIKFTY